MRRMLPSRLLDSMFTDMEIEIQDLREENERLRAQVSKLLDDTIVQSELLSARTLQMAIHGALPDPGSHEAKAQGYK